MSTTIPILWPDAINVDILAPIVILRRQASALQEITKGMLRAEIKTEDTDKGKNYHFEVIAPALNDYRARIVTISQVGPNVYPAFIGPVRASSDKEFLNALEQEFTQRSVTATLNSLIAQSNEVLENSHDETDTVPDAEA